jgi:NAD(P)H dehydrogenase (quinone)
MSAKRYLVTGATGSTGRSTVKYLRKQGAEVLALVHRDDKRAEQLRSIGAETVVGDLLHFESVRNALEGINAAYFVYPVHAGIIQATTYFAQACKEAGLSLVVNMSQISARREAKSHAAQDHWIAERVFDWSGVPITHLRPTLFAEWVLYWAPFFKKHADLNLPFTTGRHAPIAAEDQGRLIAAILLHPEEHAGQIYPLYGAVEMTFTEIAEEVGRVIGKRIGYRTIDVPSLKEITINEHHRSPGDVFWQHLVEIAVDHNNGIFAGTNDLIEKITGTPPMKLDVFIQAHKAELGA